MIKGWRNALIAILLLCGMGSSIFAYSRAVDIPQFRGLYDHLFSFVPGHWIANRLNLAAGSETNSCLFVGTSLVREGLDVDILESSLGGTDAVNIGTTAPYGAAGVFEVQAEIVAARGALRFACVVIGFNGHYLYDFTPESFDLTSTDYASQLPLASIASIAFAHRLRQQIPTFAYKIGFPLGRHSLILQRIYRQAFFDLHQSLIGRLPLSQFETFTGELQPTGPYFYQGPSIYTKAVKEMAGVIKDMKMDDPDHYDNEGPTRSLRRAVEVFNELTDHIYILRMPLTHVYDTAEVASAEAFSSAIQDLPINGVMNCEFPQDAESDVFYDSGHLNGNGRGLLSREVGEMIGRSLEGLASTPGAFCVWE